MYKYYLYRHIRLDKDEPFYIGIGTRTKTDLISGNCTRANSKVRRNQYWKNIVNITNYIVEILFESDAYQFIKEKEIEFIKLYGRKDLGFGTLVNMTNGGDGTTNIIVSIEARNKRSRCHKGRIKSKLTRNKLSNSLQRHTVTKETKDKIAKTKGFPIYQFSLIGIFLKEFPSAQFAAKELGIHSNPINLCAKLENKTVYTYGGYIWVYKHDFDEFKHNKFKESLARVKLGKYRKIY